MSAREHVSVAEHQTEAARVLTICNACRYCEGLCAVFPAMEMRRSFAAADLNYLANLCHQCGACYDDCQYAPPHEFSVNVPMALAKVRRDSYRQFTWPASWSSLFDHSGVATALMTAAAAVMFWLGLWWRNGRAALLPQRGNFYALLPHTFMAAVFGIVGLAALGIGVLGLRRCWENLRSIGQQPMAPAALWQGMADAATLRYLGGGGRDCSGASAEPSALRRICHHALFYGFVLTFLSTTAATVLHYLLKQEAPYPLVSAPVLLGTSGGVLMIIGAVGLLVLQRHRNREIFDESSALAGRALLWALIFTGSSGLLLLLLRNTAAMGLVLATHLGAVLGLFIILPYGKFIHGPYRTLALMWFAAERRSRVIVD